MGCNKKKIFLIKVADAAANHDHDMYLLYNDLSLFTTIVKQSYYKGLADLETKLATLRHVVAERILLPYIIQFPNTHWTGSLDIRITESL